MSVFTQRARAEVRATRGALIARFVVADATSPQCTIALSRESLSADAASLLEDYVARGVVIEHRGEYYLDLDALARETPNTTTRAIVGVVLLLVALAVLVFASTACTSKPEDPRLTFINIGFTLQLPEPMQQALDSLAPGFRQVNAGKFRSDIAQYAAEAGGGMQALFATVADFDGDGTLDVVIEGNSPGDAALRVIAIMNGAKPVAFFVQRIPTYDADAVGLYLSRPSGAKPGSFELVDYPDSSTVYSYARGRFVGKKVGD